MKLFTPRSLLLLSASLAFASLSYAQPTNLVRYNPPVNIVQGNQPFTDSYSLRITSPSSLTIGATVNVALNVSVLSKPAGVTDAEALSFITLTPSALTFTNPNQARMVTVAVTMPLGNYAGDYAYRVLTSGWPTGLGIVDNGATVNARVSPPQSTDTTPPAIVLTSPAAGTVYTYRPASGSPVTVLVNFSASVSATGQPIDTMQAAIEPPSVSLPVVLTTSALPASSATAQGSVTLTTPGSYNVIASATNGAGTSYATSNFSVVVEAPPPTIVSTSPGVNSTFSYTLGGAGASVPVSITATSIFGNVTSLTATLDGSPVTLNLNGVNSSLVATGSATLTVPTTGSHSLVFSAASAYGSATPVTVPFTVTGVAPAPTVSFLTPANGATFTRTSGDPATVVNYTFQGGTGYGKITSVAVKLDGVAISPAPAVTGLNTASITGGGAMSFTTAGSHTLNITVLNDGGAQASASTSFTVQQSQAQTCLDLTWLPPVSLNKTVEGGSTVPIKFTLDCNCRFVRDTSVLIAIYEVFRNGSTSTPVIYHYGTGSPNPPDYAITGNQYHLNFATAKGTHSYQVEVYTSVAGTMRLLDSKEINTKKNGSGGNCDDDDDDDHHRHRNGHSRYECDDDDHDRNDHGGRDCDDRNHGR